ncbi:MAG TPA: hypothetical protein VIM81_06770 [Gammaproteobacteria bacterium]
MAPAVSISSALEKPAGVLDVDGKYAAGRILLDTHFPQSRVEQHAFLLNGAPGHNRERVFGQRRRDDLMGTTNGLARLSGELRGAGGGAKAAMKPSSRAVYAAAVAT